MTIKKATTIQGWDHLSHETSGNPGFCSRLEGRPSKTHASPAFLLLPPLPASQRMTLLKEQAAQWGHIGIVMRMQSPGFANSQVLCVQHAAGEKWPCGFLYAVVVIVREQECQSHIGRMDSFCIWKFQAVARRCEGQTFRANWKAADVYQVWKLYRVFVYASLAAALIVIDRSSYKSWSRASMNSIALAHAIWLVRA